MVSGLLEYGSARELGGAFLMFPRAPVKSFSVHAMPFPSATLPEEDTSCSRVIYGLSP